LIVAVSLERRPRELRHQRHVDGAYDGDSWSSHEFGCSPIVERMARINRNGKRSCTSPKSQGLRAHQRRQD
jgi:hypothetical protein